MELNQAQKRYLSATLSGYEKTLRFILQIIDSNNEIGILYSTHFEMDNQNKKEIRKMIQKELRIIEKVANTFGLDHKDIDLSRSVVAQLSENWGDLIDSCSTTLTNYGKFNTESFRTYDQLLEEMANDSLKLASYFSHDK